MKAMERRPPANPIRADEILIGEAYTAVREERSAEGRRIRGLRRVAVGPYMSLAFENRDTALHQVHEILHRETAKDSLAIAEHLEAFNELIAPEGCLSATLFIEWRDLSTIRDRLAELHGLTETTFLDFPDGSRCQAQFDPYTQDEFQLSAVQYLLFELSPAQIDALRAGASPIRLTIDHDNYAHSAGLSKELRDMFGTEV